MIPNTSAPMPSVAQTAPTTSKRPGPALVSARYPPGAPRSCATPIGTLMKNAGPPGDPVRSGRHRRAGRGWRRCRRWRRTRRPPGCASRPRRSCRDQRQRGRRDDRGADPLQRRGPRSATSPWAPADQQRGEREDREPDHEQPPPAHAGRRRGRRAAAARRRPGCRRPAPRTARSVPRPSSGRMLGSPVKITELSSRIMK